LGKLLEGWGLLGGGVQDLEQVAGGLGRGWGVHWVGGGWVGGYIDGNYKNGGFNLCDII
jgi:hypothetical protein